MRVPGFGELHALLVHCLVMIGGSREPTTGLYLVGSGRQRRDGADDQTIERHRCPPRSTSYQNILRQLLCEVITVRSRTVAAATAIALLPVARCFGGSTTTDELSYQIDEPVTALVIDARAAGVAITVADGPVTVSEEHRSRRANRPPRTRSRARHYG